MVLPMRRIILSIIVSALTASFVSAQYSSRYREREKKPTYNEQIVKKYIDSIAVIIAIDSIKAAMNEDETILNNPYYYPLLIHPTMYNMPVKDIMQSLWKPSRVVEDKKYLPSAYSLFTDSVQQSMTNTLMWAYTNVPWYISTTQKDIENAAGIRKEIIDQPVKEITHITPQSNEQVDLGIEDASYKVITRRPNFWAFSGKLYYSMGQNYFSSKGAQNNNTFRLETELNANYNNQKNLTLTNNVKARLGFTSQSKDKKHKYLTSDNRVEMTNQLGLKAIKHWDYTLSLYSWTHIYPKYASNSDYVTEDFLSPVSGNIGVGMKYSIDFSTKKRGKVFHVDATFSPLSYYAVYCDRKALRNSKGIPGKHHAYNSFGPSVSINYWWQIAKSIKTSGSIYYYSNYHRVEARMQNTIDFTINRYLTSSLYLYPTFNDNRFVNGKRELFNWQETLSMGLTLTFNK